VRSVRVDLHADEIRRPRLTQLFVGLEIRIGIQRKSDIELGAKDIHLIGRIPHTDADEAHLVLQVAIGSDFFIQLVHMGGVLLAVRTVHAEYLNDYDSVLGLGQAETGAQIGQDAAHGRQRSGGGPRKTFQAKQQH